MLQAKNVIVALIGMSGAGKSAWASRLAEVGFRWLQCDALIAEKLRASFDMADGTVYDLGSWMGFPHEPRYPEREALYLAYEAEVLDEIVGPLTQSAAPAGDTIIDLTGSAVYLDRGLLARLRQVAKVVYLAVSPSRHDAMVAEYLARPRPLIWNGHYQPLPHEQPSEALRRCYPKLLAAREQLYAELSDLTLDETLHRDPAFGVDAFLGYLT